MAREQPLPEESLFNLVFDPNETNNLVGNSAIQNVLQAMRDRLTRWMEDTDDPLLKGDLPAPSGAAVNDVDGLSPTEEPQIADTS